MKRSLALLGMAASALALSLGAALSHATVIEPAPVNDAAIMDDGLPRYLSEFEFFQDARSQEPSGRVRPYALNTPLWSDGAEKLRFIYLPQDTQLTADGEGLLQFPIGSAIIKTFAFGEGADRRLIETRVLLHRADGWVALPYRWNEEQNEATLALAGARVPVTTPDGDEISYRIPNKNQCKSCHSIDGVVLPIGPKARNLAPELLAQLVAEGRMASIPEVAQRLPVWTEASESNEALARAYLDVNCAHCHQPGGGASNSGLDLRWEQREPFAFGVHKPPVAAGRGAGGLLVSIEPGDPDASIIVYRMNSAEPGIAMPELGRSTIDHKAIAVMREWIAAMPAEERQQ